VAALRACRRCPGVVPPPVAAEPPAERPRVLLVGQAPGPREQETGRPFVFTAGTRLFSWFSRLGVSEEEFRRRVWMAAALRCFPGRAPQKGDRPGDRPPAPEEIANCAPWLDRELALLQPSLVLAVGRPAIARFLPEPAPLTDLVGRLVPASRAGVTFDVLPLPHPSGRSTWLVRPENAALLDRALDRLGTHPAWRETFESRAATPGSNEDGAQPV
jgi:uracil-DNA glycosylase